MKKLFFLTCIYSTFFCINFAAKADDYAEANMLYRQAIMLYGSADYDDAAKKMQEIEQKFPDYPRIKDVLMLEAFFLYLDEKYPESQGVSDGYIELYKNDGYLPYLYFLKASAFQKRRKSPTKEYYLIQKNIDSWNEVVANDNGLYAAEARFRITELEEMQCLHELRIGDTYLGIKEYFSALRRFNNVLHCKTDKYYIEAAKRLVIIYKKINMPDQAEKYQDMIDKRLEYQTPEELSMERSFKNFLFDMIPDFGFLPSWMRVAS